MSLGTAFSPYEKLREYMRAHPANTYYRGLAPFKHKIQRSMIRFTCLEDKEQQTVTPLNLLGWSIEEFCGINYLDIEFRTRPPNEDLYGEIYHVKLRFTIDPGDVVKKE